MSTLPFETDIEANGSIKIQRVASVPVHNGAADEGRILYAEDVDQMYVGTASAWAQLVDGGSGIIDDLSDVDATTPTDGQVLTYNNSTMQWEPQDPTGGGGLNEYIAITSTTDNGNSLSLYCYSEAGAAVPTGSLKTPFEYVGAALNDLQHEWTYDLVNFIGVDYDETALNGVWVQVEKYCEENNADRRSRIEVKFPDGSWQYLVRNDDTGHQDSSVINQAMYVPIGRTQTQLEFRLTVNSSTNTTKANIDSFAVGADVEAVKVTILGVSQASGGSGSSGGSGGGTLIAYGEITDFGDIDGAPTGGASLTVVGDFTATKDTVGDGSEVICTFGTPLPNSNYNVILELISLGGSVTAGADDNEAKTPVVFDKTASGFKFNIADVGSGTQNLQVNCRIESNIPNLATDLEYVALTGTSGTALTQSGAGPYTYTLSDWTGSNFNSARVRMVFIDVSMQCSGVSGDMLITMPDGSTEVSLIELSATGSGDNVVNGSVVSVPITPGQSDFTIRVTGAPTANSFTIIGVDQVFPTLSGQTESLLIKGTSTAQANDYLDAASTVDATFNEVWTNYGSPSVNTVDWSDVLPTPAVPTTFSKTKIEAWCFLQSGGSDQEESIDMTIIIDWVNGTVKGHWHALTNSANLGTSGGGYFDGTTDALVTATNNQGGVLYTPEIETLSRTIIKLPTVSTQGRGHRFTITNFN